MNQYPSDSTQQFCVSGIWTMQRESGSCLRPQMAKSDWLDSSGGIFTPECGAKNKTADSAIQGLSVWLGLPHSMVASECLDILHVAQDSGVPVYKLEAAWPIMTSPQKSHGIHFTMFCRLPGSHSPSSFQGTKHRPYLSMARVLKICGHVLKSHTCPYEVYGTLEIE